MKVAILTYHGVEIAGAPRPDGHHWEAAYAVTLEALATQLAWLAESGTPVLRLEDLARGRVSGGAAILTFDDGYASDAAVVLPLLDRRGFPATFFVETGAVGRPGRLSREDLGSLAAAGMEIGSHTVTHRFLSELPEAEVRRELADSKRFLEDVVRLPVRFLSLPGGRADGRTVANARECGYEAVCTSVPGGNDPRRPRYLLRRLCIRRTTTLADFQRLVRLDPWRVAGEKIRYTSLRGAKRVLGGAGYARFRGALVALSERGGEGGASWLSARRRRS